MASKPAFIEKFWPVSQIKASRTGRYKEILAQRMEKSKYQIENKFGVNADKVVDIFVKAYLASDKDYPAPAASVANPQSTKDFDLYTQYIIFLWEYYVGDKKKKSVIEKEEPPKETKKVNQKQTQENGALTLYEKVGSQEEDLVEEEIDERILNLLGLTEVFDIDYATYLSLLKEKMASARMTQKTLSTEETELLTGEWRRVKGKVGRFKLKVKKISVDNIKDSSPIRIAKDKFFLAGKVSTPDLKDPKKTSAESEESPLSKDIKTIKKSVENILSLLSEQSKLFQKQSENERRIRENRKRKDKEDKLESIPELLKNVTTKILAPVKGILDKIINFIVNMILGRAFIKLMDWLQKPENQEKMKNVFRFLKDWWPALLGAYLLFGTKFGRFFLKIAGMIGKFSFQLTKKLLPQLLKLAKSPLGAGALLFTAGATIPAMFPETVDAEERKTTQIKGSTNQEKIDALLKQKQNLNFFDKMRGVGSEIDEQIHFLQTGETKGYSSGGLITKGYSSGGVITNTKNYYTQPIRANDIGFDGGGSIQNDTGVRVTGAGKDTQLIAAQPGEVVINKPTVDALGKNFFLSLNSRYGGAGANVPKMHNNIQLAAGGGVVGGGIEKKEILPQAARRPKLSKMGMSGGAGSKISNYSSALSGGMGYGKTTLGKKKYRSSQTNKTLNFNPMIASVGDSMSVSPLFFQGGDSISPLLMPFAMSVNTNISQSMKQKDYSKSFKPSSKSTYIPPSPSTFKKPNIVALPPMGKKGASGGASGPPSTGRMVPDFAVYQDTPTRRNNIQIYGIIGVD